MSVVKIDTSQSVVQIAFKVLSGAEPFINLSATIPPPLCSITQGEIDTEQGRNLGRLVDQAYSFTEIKQGIQFN